MHSTKHRPMSSRQCRVSEDSPVRLEERERKKCPRPFFPQICLFSSTAERTAVRGADRRWRHAAADENSRGERGKTAAGEESRPKKESLRIHVSMGSIDKVGKIDLGKSVGNPDFHHILSVLLRVLDKPRTHSTMLIWI